MEEQELIVFLIVEQQMFGEILQEHRVQLLVPFIGQFDTLEQKPQQVMQM